MPMLRGLAIAVFFLWMAVDGAVVFRRASSRAENRDRGSLRVLMACSLLAWLIAIWAAFGMPGALHPALPVQIAGFIAMGAGITLRFVAIAQLGRFHTPNVAVLADHQVFDRGLYRHVRHPSYLGALIAFAGFGLALDNGISVAALCVLGFAGYRFRIHEEEAALHAALGERYAEYCRRTRRLIPGLY